MQNSSHLLMIVLVFISFTAKEQTSDTGKINKYKIKRFAEYAFKKGNYFAAADLYIKLYHKEPKNADVAYCIAESYKNLRDYKNAEIWFYKTNNLDSVTFPIARYSYALMMKMNGKYDSAISVFKQFCKTYNSKNSSYYIIQAKKEIKDCNFALIALENPSSFFVERLDTNINSVNSDFAPLPFGDDTLIFSSMRLPSDFLSESYNEKKDMPVVRLYYAEKNNDDGFVFKGLFDAPFNNGKMHTANGTFSDDKKRFYFTFCNTADNSKILCNIYVSEYKKGQWQQPVKLPEIINYPQYSSTQPNFTTTAKNQDILYFTSDQPGGNGGFDIWYTVIKNGKEYSNPKNLGAKINTSGNEITPYYDAYNEILFFSSDGLKNMGGLDIFSSRGSLDKWEDPVNLGYPINSSVDDFNYVVPLSDNQGSETGYFVSNRIDSLSANKNGTCCDDIFSFKPVVTTAYIDTLKEMVFVPPDNIMNSTLPKETYYDTVKTNREDTSRRDFIKENKVEKNIIYSLKNIYFDFDKATLSPVSMAGLNDLALQLNESSGTVIEIAGYTDNKGDDVYNIILSQKRADAVVQYLVQKGVSKERFVAKGYGKDNPIAPNLNADGTDNPDGRQLNRRIEFKIIGELNNLGKAKE